MENINQLELFNKEFNRLKKDHDNIIHNMKMDI